MYATVCLVRPRDPHRPVTTGESAITDKNMAWSIIETILVFHEDSMEPKLPDEFHRPNQELSIKNVYDVFVPMGFVRDNYLYCYSHTLTKVDPEVKFFTTPMPMPTYTTATSGTTSPGYGWPGSLTSTTYTVPFGSAITYTGYSTPSTSPYVGSYPPTPESYAVTYSGEFEIDAPAPKKKTGFLRKR